MSSSKRQRGQCEYRRAFRAPPNRRGHPPRRNGAGYAGDGDEARGAEPGPCKTPGRRPAGGAIVRAGRGGILKNVSPNEMRPTRGPVTKFEIVNYGKLVRSSSPRARSLRGVGWGRGRGRGGCVPCPAHSHSGRFSRQVGETPAPCLFFQSGSVHVRAGVLWKGGGRIVQHGGAGQGLPGEEAR